MHELERRLEELYRRDARAWRVGSVGTPRRRPDWSLAGSIAAMAMVVVATTLLVGALLSERGRVASPNTDPPVLAPDGKSIVQNGRPLLAIDDAKIVQWFRSTESQQCDQPAIGRVDRSPFCTDTAAFRAMTRFVSISPSPDGTTIGLTIATERGQGTVASIFVRSSGNVTFLTWYYPGSEFLGFSPGGHHFIYRDRCYNGHCSLYIRDNATLAERLRVNSSIPMLPRTVGATFVRWISDNAIEYRLGDQLKAATFGTGWTPDPNANPPGVGPGGPVLSSDGKSIIFGGRPVLTIDNPQILQWFQSSASGLCDVPAIRLTDRGPFCTDTATFRAMSRFAAIRSSPDGAAIGFTISSDRLVPHTVAGIFLRSSGSVTILTTYYLESQFLGFSPGGTHFIYQDHCYYGRCALYVRESATLTEGLAVNRQPRLLERTQRATFVRWISDTTIEYRLGDELRRASY